MARTMIERLPTDGLEAGERWIAAQTMTVKGPKALATWAADLDLAVALPERTRLHPATSGTAGPATEIPRAFVAALSDRRVAICDTAFGGRPRSVVASWPLDRTSLDVVDAGDRVRSRLFVLGVDDGALVAGEAGINGRALDVADAFVETFRASGARSRG